MVNANAQTPVPAIAPRKARARRTVEAVAIT
jgi:hypothetical protein